MELLITTDVFSFEPAGGAGTVLFETARRLVGRGHGCTVICRRRSDLPEDGTVKGVRFLTYAAPDGDTGRLFWEGWRQTRRLARLASARGRTEAVWFHHPFPGEALRRLPEYASLPWLYTYHSPWHIEYLARRRPLAEPAPADIALPRSN
ncbi:MAG: glycosyltransferase, partial [Planctomycetes bacterium]|nr:glycosyltransferase [Planctomycetota bacterium]